MKKKTVLLFVFDGMADWGPSYALVGINKSKAYQIKTISIDKSPKMTMGGMSICPDLDFLPRTDLDDLDSSNTAMLILPGGTAWEGMKNQDIAALVYHCVENLIAVAAICNATLFMARLGLLDEVEHTSNDMDYLQTVVPPYGGIGLYRKAPSVTSKGIITASGKASMEFACDIFQSLDISENEALKEWFSGFQNKMVDF